MSGIIPSSIPETVHHHGFVAEGYTTNLNVSNIQRYTHYTFLQKYYLCCEIGQEGIKISKVDCLKELLEDFCSTERNKFNLLQNPVWADFTEEKNLLELVKFAEKQDPNYNLTTNI